MVTCSPVLRTRRALAEFGHGKQHVKGRLYRDVKELEVNEWKHFTQLEERLQLQPVFPASSDGGVTTSRVFIGIWLKHGGCRHYKDRWLWAVKDRRKQNTVFQRGRGTNKRVERNALQTDTEGGYWGLKGSSGADTKDNTVATVSQGAVTHPYRVNITHNELGHQSKGSPRSRKWTARRQ